MIHFVFRLFVGIKEVCNRILRVAANGTTAKMMVFSNPERGGVQASLFEGSMHRLG